MRHVAVPVGRAFPDAHRREMRRLQRSDMPLVHRQVGNAIEADFTVRPGLHAGPFDAVVEVLGFARREMIDDAGRTAATAGVDTNTYVIVRDPLLRIDDFPVLILIGRTGRDVGMFVRHAVPGARIAVLEGEVLGVGAVGDQDRIAAFFHRAKNIGAEHDAVVHFDRHVPIDPHAVTDFRSLLHHALPQILFSWAGGYSSQARTQEHPPLVPLIGTSGATISACA